MHIFADCENNAHGTRKVWQDRQEFGSHSRAQHLLIIHLHRAHHRSGKSSTQDLAEAQQRSTLYASSNEHGGPDKSGSLSEVAGIASASIPSPPGTAVRDLINGETTTVNVGI